MLFSLVLEERLKTIKSIQVYTVILYEFQQLSNFELEFDYTCSTIKFLDAKESFQRFDRSECRLVYQQVSIILFMQGEVKFRFEFFYFDNFPNLRPSFNKAYRLREKNIQQQRNKDRFERMRKTRRKLKREEKHKQRKQKKKEVKYLHNLKI